MAEYNFPALTEYLGSQPNAVPSQDTERLAEQGRQYLAAVRPAAATPQRNLFAAGLSAGVDELQGLGGAAVSAVGKAIGAEGLANWGAEVARRNAEEAAASGRPDLEIAPWKEGGASVLPWLGYQAAKQVPQLAALIGAGALMPAAAVPAGIARVGAAIPSILGGGGLRAGAGFAARRAGLEAGEEYAKRFLGAAAVGAPLGTGSMYQEALDRGDATRGEALAAIGLGPAYGALEAVQPAQLASVLKKGMTGGLGKRLLTGAAVGAVGEAPTEAGQTTLEMAFRPDVPFADKAQNVIDAALTGAAVGGVFGGAAGGIGKAKPATAATPPQPPITQQSSNDALAQSVDQEVRQLTYQPQQNAPLYVGPEGTAAQSLYEVQQAQAASADVQAAQQAAQQAAEIEAARQEQVRALSPQPATQLALPSPPPAPTPVQERLAGLSDKFIEGRLRQIERLVQSGEAVPADEQTMRYLRAEQDRRAGRLESTTAIPEQPNMFAEVDLSGAQQPIATKPVEPVVTPEMETMRAEVKTIIGSNKDTGFTRSITATDPVSLVRAAQDYATANPNNDGGASLFLEKLNLADPVTLTKDIAKLEKRLADLQVKALTNRAAQSQIDTVEEQLGKLNQSKALLDAVEQSRGVSSPTAAQQGALSAEVSPPASQTGPALFPEIARARRKGEQGDFGFEGMPKSEVYQRLNTFAQNQRVPATVRKIAGNAARAVRSGALDAQAQAIQALRLVNSLSSEQYGIQPQEAPAPQAQPAAPQVDVETLRTLAGVQPQTEQAVQPQLALAQQPAPTLAPAPAPAPVQQAGTTTSSGLVSIPYDTLTYNAQSGKTESSSGQSNIISYADRMMVVLDINGVRVPFYLSTGQGGKKDVPNGKWYPFFGIGADGWINKTGGQEMASYYGSKILRDAAERLDSEIGDIRKNKSVPKVKATGAHINFINSSFNPAELGGTNSEFQVRANIDNLLSLLGEQSNLARPRTQAQARAKAEKAQKAEEKPEPAAGGAAPPQQPPKAPPTPSQGPGPSGPQGDFVKPAMNSMVQALDRFLGSNLAAKRLKAALFWASRRLIVDRFDRFFEGKLSKFVETQDKVLRARNAYTKRLTGTFDKVGKLGRNNPQAHEGLAELMSYTSLGFNLSKTWQEHTRLQDAPNAQELRAEFEQAKSKYQKLKKDGWLDPKTKTENAIDVYNELIANNQADLYAQNVIMNYKKLVLDPTFEGKPGFTQNPMDVFISSDPVDQENPIFVRDYWKSVFDQQTATAQAAVDADKQNTEAKTMVSENKKLADTLEQGTYFHLGREGDQFVSFKFTPTEKMSLAQIVDQFRARLNDEGLDKFQISKMADKQNVFLRLEKPSQRETVTRILSDFVKQGLVADGYKAGSNSEKEFTSDIDVLNSANKLLQEIKKSAKSRIAKTADPDVQAAIMDRLAASDISIRRAMIELAPTNSLMTVLARRRAVSGASTDMFESAAYRNKLTADALANIAFYDDIASAYTDIALSAQEAATAKEGKIDNELAGIRAGVRDELGKRLYQDTDYTKSVLEYLRPIGYIYYLSSPASAALQMASVPTYVWPRLGAKYGFVKSAKALAKTIKMTTRIMNAAVKHGMDSGFSRGLDIFFDSKALKEAGISQETADYILRVANTTSIDLGTMARELGRLAGAKSNTSFDRVLAMAGFMNNYVEIMTRVWTALAVNELAPSGSNKVKTSADVIDSTIFGFGVDNEPRAYGQKGILKEYTPVAAQFTKINWFMIEELYRSAADAFLGTAQTEEQKKEARRFLAGHATAVAVLTGTLGLPFAASVATAINALADVFGDDEEPYDVQVAWRNWLAGTFGKEAGEIAARGLPRALGFDISERAGEANLLPFSKFLADKRKFEDKFQDFITGLAGAPIGAVSSMALGLSQISNGDVLQGMQSLFPAALRAPIQAYTLGAKGYTDKSGNVIPLDPDALDILYQAVGFKPAEKAEYDEARMAQLSRESVLTRKSGDLRRKLAVAIEDGDVAEQRKLLNEAKAFDASNPAYSVIDSLESTIKQRAKARALVDKLGITFGTNLRDLGSIEMQGFANIGQ